MAKYHVTHSCGHTEVVDLGGKTADRERKIAWMESCECPECRMAKAKEGKIMVAIKYGDWKNIYDGYFKTKEYNKETKCMDVYMTETEKEQYDFYSLYIKLMAEIGQEAVSYGDSNIYYNHYSDEFGLTAAMDIIDKLYDIAREKGLLKEETAEETTEEEQKIEEIEVEVPYSDYNDYCREVYKRVPDSYDKVAKTIKVYMTLAQEQKYIAWKAEETAKWQNVEMPYKEWKANYSNYRKHGYNDRTGTVIVTLPASIDYKRTTDEHYEERHAFRAGYTNELTITPDTIDTDDITVEIPEELKNQEEIKIRRVIIRAKGQDTGIMSTPLVAKDTPIKDAYGWIKHMEETYNKEYPNDCKVIIETENIIDLETTMQELKEMVVA